MQMNIEGLEQRICGLYRQYGYNQFKMNKFEEYDTYVKNKDFLISDKVITFTDTNGKLLAMKPDVTISIIKNSDDEASDIQRVYYNENVYRVSENSHGFREIMQSGLECIGAIDTYNICEVIMLAAKSIECVGKKYVLDISHMGLVAAILAAIGIDMDVVGEILHVIGEKNIPELNSICERYGLDASKTAKLMELINIYGPVAEVAEKLSAFCIDKETEKAVNELKEICDVIETYGLAQNVRIDFSVVNDMKYYNGIVFRGYIEDVPQGILSGGQYDRLMAKMGKKSKAIGFAVYLDLIERLFEENHEFDADVLLCYEKGVSAALVAKKASEIVAGGKSVLVQTNNFKRTCCRETIMITNEEASR